MSVLPRLFVTVTALALGVSHAVARDVDLQFTSSDGTVLRGTLSVPETPGRHAAALVVGGFGPHDRDGRFQSNMYRSWSEGLVARGVVTFRYDKRGTGSSGGKSLSWLDPLRLQDDIVAATRLLRRRPEVRDLRLTLIGHSQGGDLALAIAPRLRAVSSVVTLAAPGRPLGDYSPGGLDLVRTIVGPVAAKALASQDPLDDAARVRQPVLLVQGLADQVVDPTDANRLLRVRRRAGRPTALIRLPGLGHELLSPESDRPPALLLTQVARFLRNP